MTTRLSDRFDIGIASRFEDLDVPKLWAPLAAVPGNAKLSNVLIDSGNAFRLIPGERSWPIFSAEPINVGIRRQVGREQISRLAADLPDDAVAAYQAIAWHCDLKSGYEWDPRQFYLDVRVAPVSDADIKFPRELSRFQHVGALASGRRAESAVELLLQVIDWTAANAPRRGVNWACTMDVALRVVNWIWGLRFFEQEVLRYPTTLRVIIRSIREHGRHIENNLEYYEESTSNHYLSNIAGLLYIGAAFPDFPEADRWFLFGLQELVSEMEREVYSDGGDYEASTHYHRLVAELFASCASVAERIPPARRARLATVDVRLHRVRPRLHPASESGLNVGAAGAILPEKFYTRLARMAEFTAALTKPNGLVPQFGDNDSARVHKLRPRVDDDVRDHRHLLALVGELVDREDLRAIGANAADEASVIAGGLRGIVKPPTPNIDFKRNVVLFPISGVAVLRRAGAYVAITCGPNGQGGRGGHGHNDKNSFELNIDGLDVIVDGGCPVYSAAVDIRNLFRSTAAHNTISVDGEEQDSWEPGVRGLFRLPQRSAPELSIDSDTAVVGRHSGFGSVHERRFVLESNKLVIDDRLEHPGTKYVNFNLDPGISVERLVIANGEIGCDLVHITGRRIHLKVIGATEPKVSEGCFSLGYGVRVKNNKLSARLAETTSRTEFSWTE